MSGLHAFRVAHEASPCTIAAWNCIRHFPTRSSFAFLLGMAALALPLTCHPQSLNDAVKLQLQLSGTQACAQLRGGRPNPASYLSGELLAICTRGGGQGGITPSLSTGGGAATPTALPSIVQQRLREGRSGKKKSETRVSAASADAEDTEQFGFFIAAESESLDRDVTTFENGYDSDVQRISVGVDFQAATQMIAGLALDASKQTGNFKEGGDFEVESLGIVGFGIFQPTEKTYTQFYGGYGRHSSNRDRFSVFADLRPNGNPVEPPTASGIQHADYDANQYRAGFLLGYDYPVANATLGPFASLDWKRTRFGTYSETGNSGLELTFHDDRQTSMQSGLGLKASILLRPASWSIVPQVSATWKHEFENGQRDIAVSFVGDLRGKRFTYQTEVPDRDWGEVNIGVSAISPRGLQLFGNFRTLVGSKYFDSRAVSIGLRFPF